MTYQVNIVSNKNGIEVFTNPYPSIQKRVEIYLSLLNDWSLRLDNRNPMLSENILQLLQDIYTILFEEFFKLAFLNKSEECHQAISRLADVIDFTYANIYSKLLGDVHNV